MSLRLVFSDFYTKVHNAISGPGVPTGDDLTAAKELVYRAYRKFLYPIDQRSKTKSVHQWSWLVKDATLILTGGQDEYPLPDDFDILQDPFIYTKDTGAYGRITKVSRKRIMTERSFNTTAYQPLLCCIAPEAVDVSVEQKKTVTFWPTPSGSYQVNYSYICIPPKPVAATDVFMGNAFLDETLLQLCLAMAEQDVDEKLDVQTKVAAELLQAAINSDSKDAPNTVGRIRDGNIRTLMSLRNWSLQNSELNLET